MKFLLEQGKEKENSQQKEYRVLSLKVVVILRKVRLLDVPNFRNENEDCQFFHPKTLDDQYMPKSVL